MLNEIKEYRQYTDKIGCGRLPVAKPLQLYGLKRAMEIVARDFWFGTDFGSACTREQKVALTRYALRVWLGAPNGQATGIPAVDEKLQFLQKHSYMGMKKVIAPKDAKAFDSLIRQKRDEDFEEPDLKFEKLFEVKPYSEANKITYENVIASALSEGALKRRYLVYSNRFDSTIDLGNNQQGKTQDAVLKGMAAYLLSRTNEVQKSSCVVTVNIQNWMSGTKFMEKGRNATWHLFSNRSDSGFFTKLEPCKELLACEFQLVDENDTEHVQFYLHHSDYHLVRDDGYHKDAAKSLIDNRLYPPLK